MIDRNSLRNEFRQRRRTLTPAQQLRAAQRLLIKLAPHPWLRRAQRIAFYLANDGEIDPAPLLHLAMRQHKEVYLPVVNPRTRTMRFRRYFRGDRLHRNLFGIGEPPPQRPTLVAAQLDLILMPLVAFDRHGNRLGMGGGFYDRAFAGLNNNGPRRLGLAHHLQEVRALPKADWDVPLHAVATDNAVTLFY